MQSDLFDSTIPFGEPELMRASAYQRYLDEIAAADSAALVSTRISSLSPSLRADLYRFEQQSGDTEAVEVMAACVRHAKRLTIHLQCGDRVVPLTVFPHERLVHCPMTLAELIARHLPTLRVMHVEPAVLLPPGDPEQALVGEHHLHHPLGPLLWEMALRGQRAELLPEIAGPAVYRVAPALQIDSLPVRAALKTAIRRLRGATANLADIAAWPGLNRELAARMLNGLYLQAGLIISRSHPDAFRDGWFGGA